MNTSETPTAAALIIGNEILSGRTPDKNISFIALRLAEVGILLCEVRVVPDIEAEIVEAVNALRAKYTYLITTGGIGPTHDDITLPSVAKAFGVPLEENEEALFSLEAFYGAENMNRGRRRMALVPQGAAMIETPVTAAPGVRVENVFILAGVPEIMRGMMDAMMGELRMGEKPAIKTVRCEGLAESLISDALTALDDAYPLVEIGSYPTFSQGQMGLAFVIKSFDAESCALVAEKAAQIIRDFGHTPRISDGY